MRSSTSARSIIPLLTFLASFTNHALAQDDVCFAPVGKDGSIGNVSFDSIITDTPLFWIATVKHDNERMNVRQFHLFTEDKQVRLGSDKSDFNGCGLALTGVTKTDRQVMIPEVRGRGDTGCDVVLGQECAADVLAAARRELDAVLRNATDSQSPEICSDVRNRLFASSKPDSCDVNVWASIMDIALTGPDNDVMNITYVEGESDCADGPQVTELFDKGQTFALFPLSSFAIPQDGTLEEAKEWAQTSTPMVSLFWAGDGSLEADLEELDISLNCVAAANASDSGPPEAQQSSGTAGARPCVVPTLVSLLGIVLMLA